MVADIQKPAIIAHRGASMYAPENTLAAFNLALSIRADGIEMDVKLTKDGEVVVIHDQTVSRTTGREGLVSKLSLSELKRLDAGKFFADMFQGEKIPTLEEVLDLIEDKLFLFIELTNYSSWCDDLVEKTVNLVRNHHLEGNTYFLSFLPLNISKVKKMLPEAKVGLLGYKGLPGGIARSKLFQRLSPDFIIPHYGNISPSLVKKEHRQCRKVITWTVNTPTLISEFIKIGIDGLITDDPKMAVDIRGKA